MKNGANKKKKRYEIIKEEENCEEFKEKGKHEKEKQKSGVETMDERRNVIKENTSLIKNKSIDDTKERRNKGRKELESPFFR